MDDNFLSDWDKVIKEQSKTIRCLNCRTDIDVDKAQWTEISGNPGRNAFCDDDCVKNYINKEIQYHKDMIAELEIMRVDLE